MVTRIELNCPCCHQRCEIFLCTSATFIFLNCPDCGSPLVYDHHSCSLVGKHQIEQIRDVVRENHTAAGGYADPVPTPAALPARCGEMHQLHATSSAGTTATLTQRCDITQDDVTNLRIELETCCDSLEFMERM